MPINTVYHGHRVSQVRWRASDWHPRICNTCNGHLEEDEDCHPDYFYDVQFLNHDIVNEDVAYCSAACARDEIDRRINSGLSGGTVAINSEDTYDTQEETTED